MTDVIVVGAGVIGAAVAYAFARAGASVQICGPVGGPGDASWASAGMLAPAAELLEAPDTQPALADALSAGPPAWSDWFDDLATHTPEGLDHQACGALYLPDASETSLDLDRCMERVRAAGLSARWVSGAALQTLQPGLGAEIDRAVWLAGDGQVDNRALVPALLRGAIAAGAEHIANVRLRAVRPGPELTLDGPSAAFQVSGPLVILATGAAPIPGLNLSRAFVPVKGQAMAVRAPKTEPRTLLRSRRAYLARKASGRVVVGASVEPGRYDLAWDSGVLDQLREHAARIYPSLQSGEVIERWAGVRPGVIDGRPLIGPTDLDGVWFAGGHFRHGVLLAAWTAKRLVSAYESGFGPELRAFDPRRFSQLRDQT